MNPTINNPLMVEYLLLLCGLMIALAWYLDWWKKKK